MPMDYRHERRHLDISHRRRFLVQRSSFLCLFLSQRQLFVAPDCGLIVIPVESCLPSSKLSKLVVKMSSTIDPKHPLVSHSTDQLDVSTILDAANHLSLNCKSPSTDSKGEGESLTEKNSEIPECSKADPSGTQNSVSQPEPPRSRRDGDDSSVKNSVRLDGYDSDDYEVDEEGIYDEIEIEDMDFDEETQAYYYPCPCGDKFVIELADLEDGEDIATCPSCSLMIRIIYDPEDFME